MLKKFGFRSIRRSGNAVKKSSRVPIVKIILISLLITGVVKVSLSLTTIRSEHKAQYSPDNSDLLSERVTSIYVDSFDVKWFGTDNGISRFDGSSWTEFTTETEGIPGNGLLSNNVRDIAYEKTGYGHEIWIATDSGLSVAGFNADGVTSATTYTPANSGMLSMDVQSVGVDIRHNRWAGTPLGLSLYRGANWADTNKFMDEDHGWINFTEVETRAMAAYDKDSMIFIASDSAGLIRFSYDEIDGFTGASAFAGLWSQFSYTVNDIVTLPDSVQWYATPRGAFMHLGNAAKSYWTYYPVDSGLLSSNVTAIEVDDAGNVWMGTDRGLTIKSGNEWFQYPYGIQAKNIAFDPDTMNVMLTWEGGTGVAPGSGLIHPVINDIKKDFSGNVWVATDGGIEMFDGVPETYGSGYRPKRVVFLKEGTSGDVVLTDGQTYSANSVFGEGSSVSDWYCVYNGTGSSVFVSGLLPETGYRAMVIEYSGGEGAEVYVNEVAEGNPANFVTDEGYDDIGKFNDRNIRIYPVPFTGHITIETPVFEGPCQATIYGMDGKLRKRVVLTNSITRLNTGDLEPGNYILQLKNGDKIYSFKITRTN